MYFQLSLKIFLIIISSLIQFKEAQDLVLLAHVAYIRGVSFSNDNRLISAADDQNIKIWDPSNNWTSKTFSNGNPIFYYIVSYVNKNGLFAASNNNLTNIWSITDRDSLTFMKTFYEHTNRIVSLAITSANIIATGSDDCTIKIWNLTSNSSLMTLEGHSKGVFRLAFLNDYTLASGSSDNTIKIWNTSDGTCLKTLTGHSSSISSMIAISTEILVTGSFDKSIKIWNTTNSTCVATLNGHTDWIEAIVEINSTIIASASSDLIKMWEINDFKNIFTLNLNQSGLLSMSYSSNLDILVVGMKNGILNVWFNLSSMIKMPTILQNSNALTKNVESFTSIATLPVSNEIELTSDELISAMFNSNDTSISLDSILSLSSSSNDTKHNKLIIGLLSQSKYDLTDCLSNCSNHGKCKLIENNRMKCECESSFSGSKCQVDLRPCSYSPCLNSIGCKNIIHKDGGLDFECECKDKSKYYGKRCENKVNLCRNETCSGNGFCKIINENEMNETIKCECFGIGLYEGEKCEFKTTKMILIQTATRATTYIAIISVVFFFLLILLLDVHNFIIKPKNKQKVVKKSKKCAKKKQLVSK